MTAARAEFVLDGSSEQGAEAVLSRDVQLGADRASGWQRWEPAQTVVGSAPADARSLVDDSVNDEVELSSGCDAVVVVTDWQQHRTLPLERMREVMRGQLVLDARNLLVPEQVPEAGLAYAGVRC